MKKQTYWQILGEDILSRKALLILILLTAAACFGFPITNYSMGIDDCAGGYYLTTGNSGSMVQQGRLLHVVLDKLTGCMEFLPFFPDFVGAVLFCLSALLYCGVFQYAAEGKLSTAALAGFSCVYLSSSILAEKFIYQLDVLPTMVSYCTGALALLYGFRFVKEGGWHLFGKAAGCLMVSMASYESFLFLYFCGVFSLFLLEMVRGEGYRKFRLILTDGLKYAAILIAAFLTYYILVFALQSITGQLGQFVRMSVWSVPGVNPVEMVKIITLGLWMQFSQGVADGYLPVVVFLLLSAAGFLLSLRLALGKKNPWIPVCFAALWIGNLLIHYIVGSFTARAAQTFCFFSGFVSLLFLTTAAKAWWKKLLPWVAALLVFVQCADMTRWFYNDHVRYRKEEAVIHAIAQKVLEDCDPQKPLVFSAWTFEGDLNTALYPGRQVNGNSLIYWMGYAFNSPQQPFISEVFRLHGYDFIQSPTRAQYDRAQEQAETMPPWPAKGSIQEGEDYIVVNFG